MNIFAKIIFTSNQNIKNELLKCVNFLEFKKDTKIEIYSKKDTDHTKIFIFCNIDFLQKRIDTIKENFEILYFLSLEPSFLVNDLELRENDVIMPYSFIDIDDNVFFIKNIVDKNYNLNSFWLILNWMCLSIKKEQITPDLILKIKKEKNCDIIDFNNFEIIKILKKNDLIEKAWIINIIWDNKEAAYNWVSIALMQL